MRLEGQADRPNSSHVPAAWYAPGAGAGAGPAVAQCCSADGMLEATLLRSPSCRFPSQAGGFEPICCAPVTQGWALWRQQLRALLAKRALCALRDAWAALVQVRPAVSNGTADGLRALRVVVHVAAPLVQPQLHPRLWPRRWLCPCCWCCWRCGAAARQPPSRSSRPCLWTGEVIARVLWWWAGSEFRSIEGQGATRGGWLCCER